MRRALFATLILLAAACSRGATRVTGSVDLGAGQRAPDELPHRLVIGAFAASDIDADTRLPRAGARPVSGLYVTIVTSNGSFASGPVIFELFASDGAVESQVFAWWNLAAPPGEEGFVDLVPGDLLSPPRRIFTGRDGSSGAHAGGVDLVLDRTLLDWDPLHAPTPTPAP